MPKREMFRFECHAHLSPVFGGVRKTHEESRKDWHFHNKEHHDKKPNLGFEEGSTGGQFIKSR